MTKRFLSAIILLLLASHIAFAVPASPDIVDALQPDGSSIKTRIRGDEFQNWIETEETGHTIIKNRTSGYWEYAEQAKDGSLRANGIRVLPNGRNAPATLKKSLRPPRNKDAEERMQKMLQETYQQRSSSVSLSQPEAQAAIGDWVPVPVSGSKKMLVIMVGFADKALSTTPASWSAAVFDTAAASVAKYYQDNSFSTLSIIPVTHTQNGGTPAGVVSVTLPTAHPDTAGSYTFVSDQTWGNSALQQAAPYVNFNSLDSNGDGKLDTSEVVIYFIAAGYETSASSGLTPSMWAHAWWTSGTGLTAGTKNVQRWALNGEFYNATTQMSMGVIAHELGHQLCGLPDLYDTSGNNNAMGNFSLMAGGSWGRDTGQTGGTTPTLLDVWSREFLGWTSPLVPLEAGTISLNHPLDSTTSAYKLIKPATSSTEYFLVENRQPTGWDLGLRGFAFFGSDWAGGLLITHIDNVAGTAGGNDINSYAANSVTPGHQGVLPVQASTATGNMLSVPPSPSYFRGAPTTLFYAGNVANWNPLTSPDSNYYNGNATDFSLTGISTPGSTMTATLSLVPPVIRTLTITRSGTGSGTVLSTPAGISCGSSCSASFQENTSVVLSAAPIAGSLFTGWTGGGCSGTGDCQLSLAADTTINASFAPSTTLLEQNFDLVTPSALPAGWQSTMVIDTSTPDPEWYTHTGTRYPSAISAHTGPNLVLFNSYEVSPADAAALVSPAFSLNGIASSKVKFWMYRDSEWTNADLLEVYVNSADNLTGATLLGTVNRLISLPPVVGNNGWYEYTFDIPGTFSSVTNYLLFKGVGAYGNDIHLDDISVSGITTAPPGAPTDVSATPGNALATVAFTRPASDGSSPILDYTVTSAPGSHTVTGAQSPLIVTGLDNGTTYSFTVTARNSTGSGISSGTSNSVTPRTVPDAPTIGTATAGNASASVSFTAPAADGGSTILDYTVTASPDGYTATGSSSPLTVSGLAIGSAYSFTVTARNIAGSSAASTVSNTVTPFTNIKIGSSGYSSVAAAYTAIAASDVLQLRDLTFSETLDFNRGIAFTLRGGYNADFTANSGATTINGSLTITSGTVTLDSITII